MAIIDLPNNEVRSRFLLLRCVSALVPKDTLDESNHRVFDTIKPACFQHPVTSIMQWAVYVSPMDGWRPSYYEGLMTGLVVLAVTVAALLFAVLVSRFVLRTHSS